MKLAIITVSTREGRVGDKVSDWVLNYAKRHAGFDDVEQIDLKQLGLPLLNEPNHPAIRDYKFDYTKKWSAMVEAADAFVFVTPEYDYFAPASLVNAVDYLAQEWNYKPAALVGYGGISGGLRSIQAAKPLLTTVKMMPIPESVSFHFVQNNIEDGKLVPERKHDDMARLMLNELVKWTIALKTLRTEPGHDPAQ